MDSQIPAAKARSRLRTVRNAASRAVCATGAVVALGALALGAGGCGTPTGSELRSCQIEAAVQPTSSTCGQAVQQVSVRANLEPETVSWNIDLPWGSGRGSHRVTYHGGPVQHHPQIYTIFWRDGAAGRATQDAVNATFNALSGSHWAEILSLYYDARGPVSDQISVRGTWTDPHSMPDSFSVVDEINKAIARNGWTPTRDSEFFVFLPTGTSISDSGGFHDYTARYNYAVIHGASSGDYYPVTKTATHELAEIATDPFASPGAWFRDGSGDEISDLCNDVTSNLQVPGIGKAMISGIVNPATGKCAPSDRSIG